MYQPTDETFNIAEKTLAEFAKKLGFMRFGDNTSDYIDASVKLKKKIFDRKVVNSYKKELIRHRGHYQ